MDAIQSTKKRSLKRSKYHHADTCLMTATKHQSTSIVAVSNLPSPQPLPLKAADRFMRVFKASAVLPVTLTSVKAYQKDGNNIAVEWQVAQEQAIKQYEVEKSLNGSTFHKAGETASFAVFT